MAQELYNEGRVVGLSAWELFMRDALSNGVLPEDIPNEQQWLTSMIGMGSSMVLKIPANTTQGIHDFELPIGSNLTAAGVVIANPFIGNCEWDLSNWAKKVTSYSHLIENTSSSSPSGSTVPSGTYSVNDYKDMVSEFAKLTDGVAFTKNANWIPTQSGTPYKDIDPNFNSSTTVVRIYVSDTLKYDVSVIFTGFTNKRILQGVSGYAVADQGHSVGGSADTDNNDWINGGMLGPEIIPWSTKIMFSVPNSTHYLLNKMTRTIPSDTSYTAKTVGGIEFKNVTSSVKVNSVIDFNSINVGDYYTVHASEFINTPTLQENVSEVSLGINDSYNTLTAWYPGMTASAIKNASDNSKIFPPALYATQITSTGANTLVPMDVAAPGTVKGFSNSTKAYNYTQQMPDNFAVYYNSSTNMFSFVVAGDSDPTHWAGTSKLEYLTTSSPYYPKAKLTVGSTVTQFISLTSPNGTPYGNNGVLDGSGGTVTSTGPRTLVWSDLLSTLKANQQLNILGTKLTNFATELNSSNKIGITNTTTEIGSAKFTITGTNSVNLTATSNLNSRMLKVNDGASIKLGTNFIEFSNGKRLYISNSDPGTANVPDGSIGIGW